MHFFANFRANVLSCGTERNCPAPGGRRERISILERGSAVPRLAAREISRIETAYSSDLGTFSWSWVVRADGEVQYRLSHVDGRSERNPWRSVCRLTAVELRAIYADPPRATDLLMRLARERGHFPVDNRR
jgi:hypothetical protein